MASIGCHKYILSQMNATPETGPPGLRKMIFGFSGRHLRGWHLFPAATTRTAKEKRLTLKYISQSQDRNQEATDMDCGSSSSDLDADISVSPPPVHHHKPIGTFIKNGDHMFQYTSEVCASVHKKGSSTSRGGYLKGEISLRKELSCIKEVRLTTHRNTDAPHGKTQDDISNICTVPNLLHYSCFSNTRT